MKRNYKLIIVLIIIISILVGNIAMAAGTKQKIEVVFNSVKLVVNGKKVNADNILYNGTTYVPLRAISEMLNKEVIWDKDTNTASINDKTPVTTPIKIEQLPYNFEIIPPDILGISYLKATYTNNSKYPILSFTLKLHYKDENETTYISTYDTVMPGETSPIFETFGPESNDLDDIEVLNISIKAKGENGKNYYIEYDTKLKEYDFDVY